MERQPVRESDVARDIVIKNVEARESAQVSRWAGEKVGKGENGKGGRRRE